MPAPPLGLSGGLGLLRPQDADGLLPLLSVSHAFSAPQKAPGGWGAVDPFGSRED